LYSCLHHCTGGSILEGVSQTETQLLVELYEYKVADMLAKRDPRGGKQSVRELREKLTTLPLSSQQLRRFRSADRSLRQESASPISTMQVIEAEGLEVGLGEGFLFTQTAPANINEVVQVPEMLDEEGEALQALGIKLWRADLLEEMLEQGRKWRSETNRTVLRLIYAVLHNLDLYAEQSTFAFDLNLSKLKVSSKVPEPNDTLIRLSDGEAVDGLMTSLLHHIVDFSLEYPKLSLPESEILVYLRRFALAVAGDHLAGEPPPAIQPSPREINNAIDQIRRENMNPETKAFELGKLNRQLESAVAKEREQAQAVQQERKNLLAAVDTLLGYLTDRLPARYGGKDRDIVAPSQVHGAQVENRRLETILPDTKQVVVRLNRTTEFEMGNHHLQLMNRPEGWVAAIGGAEYPIRNDSTIPLEGRELRLFVEQAYVLMQLRDRDGGGLWHLLAIAKCTAVLLDPAYNFLNMRLMRATVSWIRDRRIEPRDHHPETGATYATAPEDNLLKYARNASEKVLERLMRSPAGTLEKSFATAAEVLNEEDAQPRSEVLSQIFAQAMRVQPGEFSEGVELKDPNQVLLVTYRGEPITVRVVNRAFTIRTDNMGKMYAFAPGSGGRAFEDVLSLIVPGGFVMFARDGLRVAVGFLPTG
jgi:hypothetical protein